MLFVWLMACLAGGVLSGQVETVNTRLTADISDSDTNIAVVSTTGLPDSGIIVIEDEHIAYSQTTDTSVYGSVTSPVVRGAQDTEPVAHAAGALVTTIPGSMINSSFAYNIAVLTDTAGVQAFVSAPLSLFRLLGGFFSAPLEFLGTNLSLIIYLWIILGIGILVSLTISLAGGRRV